MTPLALSVVVAAAAVLIDLVPAVLVAVWLARARGVGRTIVQALVLAPLVLPPVFTGWVLLRVLGRGGPLGALGVPFTTSAAVLAAAVLAFPLVVRPAQLAIQAVDPRLAQAAATLGASPARALRTVVLPLALPGVIAGALLGFARALGEFGATLVLAGNIPGATRTVPLALWTALQVPGGEAEADRWALASLGLSAVALIAAELAGRAVAGRAA